MNDLKFPKLTAAEMEVRVDQVTKQGVTMLIYKDSRCDQAILDRVVGPMNWQRDHKELKGVLYGGVGIWDEEKKQWVWKYDAGKESDYQSQKGEASDSFKRACFNWGIGRELYTAPDIFCKANTMEDGKKGSKTIYKLENKYEFVGAYVSDIMYDGDNISGIEITKGKSVIWSNMPTDKKNKPQAKSEAQTGGEKISPERVQWIKTTAKNYQERENLILLDFGIDKIEDLTNDMFAQIVDRVKKGEL